MKDLKLTPDGDLDISDSDLISVESLDHYEQMAVHRIKSIDVDWYKDSIGANLEENLGKPNTKETSLSSEERIYNALTFDGFFLESEISIESYPMSKSMLTHRVTIRKENSIIRINVSLDLIKGVTIWEV